MASRAKVRAHLEALSACRRCPAMHPPVVVGRPVADARILLVGQAPGDREGVRGQPFAHTAGKTLFAWLGPALEADEERLRDRLWFSAVCRCFPGKKDKGGDRVPAREEIEACAGWLDAEIAMLRPELVLAVGKLAIAQFLEVKKLDAVVGRMHEGERAGVRFDLLPLPHPSGVSTWHRKEPGKALLEKALAMLSAHPAAASLRG
jgi:uracil-DNA glycosylase